tara:strand:+ start:72 stop:668 length:597 start_codon:yes stop_codon:yes gene_type:complete
MRPWLLTWLLTRRGALAWQLLDDDHSGRIAYSELSMGLRQELGMSRKDLPEEELQGLWNALDEDSSGFISAGEFVRFVKRGAAGLPAPPEVHYLKTKKKTRLRVNIYEDEWEEEAMARAMLVQQDAAREAERLEAKLARSRANLSTMRLPPSPTKSPMSPTKRAFLTNSPSSPSLPPINPQAARSAFAASADRFSFGF